MCRLSVQGRAKDMTQSSRISNFDASATGEQNGPVELLRTYGIAARAI